MKKILLILQMFGLSLCVGAANTESLVVVDGMTYTSRPPLDLAWVEVVDALTPQRAVEYFGDLGENGAFVLATKEFLATHPKEDAYRIIGTKDVTIFERVGMCMQIVFRHYVYFGVPILICILLIMMAVLGRKKNQPTYSKSSPVTLKRRIFGYLIDQALFKPILIGCAYFWMIKWPLLSFLSPVNRIYLLFVVVLFFYLYYYIFEFLFGGTPGKLLCGYRVVTTSSKPFSIVIAIRTLARLIPYDEISFLFVKTTKEETRRLWHDVLSESSVAIPIK